MNDKRPTVTRETLKTAKRLLGYVTAFSEWQFIIVVICILMCSVASISVSLSMRFLLDDYIIPLNWQYRSEFFGNVPCADSAWHHICFRRYRFLYI